VPRNPARARELYTQAAREGEPAARQKLAQLGRTGSVAKVREPKVVAVAYAKKH
jgi:hypothetical protein